MKKDKILRKNTEIVSRKIGNEIILLPIYKTSEDINCIYTLNRSAAFVWDAIDGKRTEAKIKKMVSRKFEATSGEVNKHMLDLLKDLKEIKAIT